MRNVNKTTSTMHAKNTEHEKPQEQTMNETAKAPDCTQKHTKSVDTRRKEKPINTMNSTKTNPDFRKSVQTACQNAFKTACDREHFISRMDGIAHLLREISDTPQSDVSFIEGAAWALLTNIGWSE